ncbi:MAG: hypothetical protein ACRD1H_08175, partial [Vicinamibacterales bacterium]
MPWLQRTGAQRKRSDFVTWLISHGLKIAGNEERVAKYREANHMRVSLAIERHRLSRDDVERGKMCSGQPTQFEKSPTDVQNAVAMCHRLDAGFEGPAQRGVPGQHSTCDHIERCHPFPRKTANRGEIAANEQSILNDLTRVQASQPGVSRVFDRRRVPGGIEGAVAGQAHEADKGFG